MISRQASKFSIKQKPTCLETDWSKSGIGFWLSQKHCHCTSTVPFCCPFGWKTTLIGSRFTNKAEANYAPIEGEALAVADSLEKARFFVLGCNDLTIAVDYKPLLNVFNDRSLDKIPNSRLRNPKERTLWFRFNMVHIPGVKHKAADTASRYPTGPEDPESQPLPEASSVVCTSVTRHYCATWWISWCKKFPRSPWKANAINWFW